MGEYLDINQQIDLIINSKRVDIVALTKAREDSCPFEVEPKPFSHEHTEGFIVSKCRRCNFVAGIIHKHQDIESLAKIEIQHRCGKK